METGEKGFAQNVRSAKAVIEIPEASSPPATLAKPLPPGLFPDDPAYVSDLVRFLKPRYQRRYDNQLDTDFMIRRKTFAARLPAGDVAWLNKCCRGFGHKIVRIRSALDTTGLVQMEDERGRLGLVSSFRRMIPGFPLGAAQPVVVSIKPPSLILHLPEMASVELQETALRFFEPAVVVIGTLNEWFRYLIQFERKYKSYFEKLRVFALKQDQEAAVAATAVSATRPLIEDEVARSTAETGQRIETALELQQSKLDEDLAAVQSKSQTAAIEAVNEAVSELEAKVVAKLDRTADSQRRSIDRKIEKVKQRIEELGKEVSQLDEDQLADKVLEVITEMHNPPIRGGNAIVILEVIRWLLYRESRDRNQGKLKAGLEGRCDQSTVSRRVAKLKPRLDEIVEALGKGGIVIPEHPSSPASKEPPARLSRPYRT